MRFLADTAGRMGVSLDAADVLLSGPPGVHITAAADKPLARLAGEGCP